MILYNNIAASAGKLKRILIGYFTKIMTQTASQINTDYTKTNQSTFFNGQVSPKSVCSLE